ncbi:MAG: choice-of-anchor D domain-containing protein [Verrucomicrobia bacterium]|nr:choice-of-anchor D domain-containing protein [Verrucomicrobiota bacterium]
MAQSLVVNPAATALTVTPDPLNLTVRSGESASVPLEIANPSTGAVDWNAEILDAAGRSNSMEAVLAAIDASGTTLNGPLPDRYDFTEGETGTYISTGVSSGTAIFAQGNKLTTNLGGPLAYSNGAVASSPILGADGRYFTRKLPGLFVFATDLNGVSWFEVAGTFQYYGFARQTSTFSLTRAAKQWSAFVVKFRGTYSKTVNHLILVDQAGLTQTTGTTDTDQKHRIEGLSGKRRLYHLLFVTNAMTVQPDSVFQELANRLLDTVPNTLPGVLSASPAAGTTPAEGTGNLTVSANAVGLAAGSYAATLALTSPAASRVATVPVTVEVTAPRLILTQGPLTHLTVTSAPTSTARVAIQTGLATEQPWSAQVLTPVAWLTFASATGTTPEPLELRFTPGTLATGKYTATVRITSGPATFDLPVVLWIDPLVPSFLRADLLRPQLYALNKGTQSGEVLVLSEATGAITKVIPVGKAPQDCAFSPDGRFLYTANGNESVSEIDLTTLEVTRTRAVTLAMNFSPTRFNLAVGRNGVVYHTDGASFPALRVVDFASGTFLSGFSGHGAGSLWFDSIGQRLYCQDLQMYYHSLMAFTAQGSTLTQNTLSDSRVGKTDSASNSLVLGSLNRDRLAAMDRIYQLPAMTILGPDMPVNVRAMSAYGDLVAGGNQVVNSVTGVKVADLPVSATLMDFTHNQDALVYYNSTTASFAVWNVPAAIRPPAIAIAPLLPPGGILPDDSPILSWNSLPFVEGFRVFVGTDRNAVANASAGSPEDRGVVTGNSFDVASLIAPGTAFFWRIDPIRQIFPVSGTVQSATRAAFHLNPAALALRYPLGIQPQQAALQVLGSDGVPAAWSVAESIPWFTPAATSGSAGTPLTGTVNLAGLALGSHTGTLAISSGGVALTTSLTLTLYTPDLSLLRADPSRPWVYGLHKGTTAFQESQILAIRADTGTIEKVLSVGGDVSDFSIDPIADRLYAISTGKTQLQVVDLASFSLLPPLTVPNDITAVAADRNGRLFLQRSSSFDIRDAATGVLLGQKAANGALWTEVDPTGRFYFDVSTTMNNTGVEVFDVTTNTPVKLPTVIMDAWSTRRPVVSPDGSRLFYLTRSMNLARELIAAMGEQVNSTSYGGGIAIGDTKIWWAQSGVEAASLPFTATLSAVTTGDEFLVLYNASAHTVSSVRLASLLTLPGPNPQPGATLPSEGPLALSWSPVAGATAYRVFLGSSQAEVTAAVAGSALQLGTPGTPQWTLATPLAYGYRYFWRVDAVTPAGTVTGTVWSFDVPLPATAAPISVSSSAGNIGAKLQVGAGGLAVGPDNDGESDLFDLAASDGHPVFKQSVPTVVTGYSHKPSPVIGERVVVVGDRYDATGGSSAGSLAVFERWQGNVWHYASRVVPPSVPANALLGSDLVTDGNLFLAGMPGSRGRVAAYREWPDFAFMQEFQASDGVTDDKFGTALAMQGNRALIGAPGTYTRQGRAYIFEFTAATRTWVQRASLMPASPSGTDYPQGGTVALDGDRAVLGTASGNPQVHVFTRSSATSWPLSATLVNPAGAAASYGFGMGLALAGDMLFVGAPTTTVFGEARGIVHVFLRTGTTWRVGAPIRPPAGTAKFGTTLAVRDGALYVASTGKIHSYRIATQSNKVPRFITTPPGQLVSGRAVDLEIAASDADGNAGLTIQSEVLPTGVTLQDLGNGRAKLTGTPTAAKGTSQFARWRVTDTAGASAYQASVVTLLGASDLPQVATQPLSQARGVGMDLVLRASATGIGPFTWQWKRDGTDLPGATDASLYLDEITAAQAGVYTVAVRNAVGEVLSNPAAITVPAATRFGGDWETFGNSAAHTGHYPAALDGCAFVSAWSQTAQTGTNLNRAVISGGRAFVVPNAGGFSTGNSAKAFDLASGTPLWAFPIASSFSYNPPTVHDGRVYFQRGKGVSDPLGPLLFCLSADTGALLWAAVFEAQWDSYQAPAVTDLGIFINGGYYGGMYGFELSGTQRFYLSSPSTYDDWTPTIHHNRLFSWVAGGFTEHDPKDGSSFWNLRGSWTHTAYSMNTIAALQGTSAALISNEALACVDLQARATRWQVPLKFTGSPAIFSGKVYAIQGSVVRSYALADGTPGPVFQTTATELIEQPLLCNDRLLVATGATTWIFNLADGQLLQTLNAGGKLSYSNGYLLAAGGDGVLRAFLATPLPRIVVEQPVGTGLTDGASTVDFGMVLIGQTAAKDFTIRNTGAADLAGLAVTIDGAAAGDFTVTTPPAATVAPGASTTFTLTFAPAASGMRDAGLHLISNDPAHNPFDLTLSGQGNHAPAFAGYALGCKAGQMLSIQPAKILARASDADGDAITLTRAIGPSAQGGTVALTATVNYTPPAGLVGTDSFEVELTDARGATGRGTLSITVTEAPAGVGAVARNLTDFSLHDGVADMVFRGIPGRSYTIQRSTDLSVWSDLATVTAGADGKLPYTDPAPPLPQAYYRTQAN